MLENDIKNAKNEALEEAASLLDRAAHDVENEGQLSKFDTDEQRLVAIMQAEVLRLSARTVRRLFYR